MDNMVFLIGGIVLFFCTVVQSLITILLIRLIYTFEQKGYYKNGLVIITFILEIVVAILISSFLLQILIWAYTYILTGEFTDIITAFYHSAVNYTTLGYGDIVMSEKWRILGTFEAMNGLIMGGFSASLFFAITSRIISAIWKMTR